MSSDGDDGAERFSSRSFRWDTPIDEASWQHAHNVRHHGRTNIAAADPDIHFGPVRLTEQTLYAPWNRIAIPFTLVVLLPNFLFVISAHAHIVRLSRNGGAACWLASTPA